MHVQENICLFSGILTVNGREYRGSALGSFQGLDLVESMYMGGVPDYTAIATSSGFQRGFVGKHCTFIPWFMGSIQWKLWIL